MATLHVPRPDIDEVAGGLKTDADKGGKAKTMQALWKIIALPLSRDALLTIATVHPTRVFLFSSYTTWDASVLNDLKI